MLARFLWAASIRECPQTSFGTSFERVLSEQDALSSSGVRFLGTSPGAGLGMVGRGVWDIEAWR